MGTINFHCMIPEVLEYMPIIESSDFQFDWVEDAKRFYQENDHPTKTTRCPGIFSLMSVGWVHRTYQDIVIETNGDGRSFIVNTMYDQKRMINGEYLGNYVSSHGPNQLNSFKKFTTGTLASIVKIQSPWFVEIPEEYSLLMLPIPYADDVRFTAAHGILRGNQFLNVQLYWHCLNGKETIKAGTPINQMILIRNKQSYHNLSVVQDAANFLKMQFKNKSWWNILTNN